MPINEIYKINKSPGVGTPTFPEGSVSEISFADADKLQLR
jgi:hypothetical protein